MKKKILMVLLVLFSAGLLFATDPAEGYWKSIDEKTAEVTGLWFLEVEANGKLFGTLLWAPRTTKTELATSCTNQKKYKDFGSIAVKQKVLGTKWLYNLQKGKNPGSWSKGYIIDPGDGKHYYGKVFKKGNTLIMRGSLDKLGALGRSQTWVRSSKAEVDKAVATLK